MGPSPFDSSNETMYFLLHGGFLQRYINIRGQLIDLLTRTKPSTVRVAGPSLGAAMAVYFSFEASHRDPQVNIELYTFALPNVGDVKFTEAFEATPNLQHVGYMLDNDLVKGLPHAVYSTEQMNHLREPTKYPPPRSGEAKVAAFAPGERRTLLPVSLTAVIGDRVHTTDTWWRSLASHQLTSYMLVLSELRRVFSTTPRNRLRPNDPITKLIVSIRTMDKGWELAGTNDDVWISILGTKHKLDNAWRDDFEPGQVDYFELPVPQGTTVSQLRESGYELQIDNNSTNNWSSIDAWLPEWVNFEVETVRGERVQWGRSVLNVEGHEPYVWIRDHTHYIFRGTWPGGWTVPINPEADFLVSLARSSVYDGMTLYVLDVPAGKFEPGARVVIYRRSGDAQSNQLWRIAPALGHSDTVFIYPTKAPHLVLSVRNGSDVVLTSRAGAGSSERWRIETVPQGRSLIWNEDGSALKFEEKVGVPLNSYDAYNLMAAPLLHGGLDRQFVFLPHGSDDGPTIRRV